MSFVSQKVIQIEWVDAVGSADWQDADTVRGPKTLYTVGYLLEMDRESVTLFMTQSEEDRDIGMVKVIPRRLVRAIRAFVAGPRLRFR